jgi:hypothetical protein
MEAPQQEGTESRTCWRSIFPFHQQFSQAVYSYIPMPAHHLLMVIYVIFVGELTYLNPENMFSGLLSARRLQAPV